MTRLTNCGKCHTCGHKLMRVLDGEEYCRTCRQYRRYESHGWSRYTSGAAEWNSACISASDVRGQVEYRVVGEEARS